MGQGKGSAILAITLLVCLLLIQSEMAQAKVYIVGGAKGWTFNVNTWTKGKIFHAVDELVFNYSPIAHSVVASTNRVAYNWCLIPRGTKVHKTGKDTIKLVKGYNYFFCGFSTHCKAGLKMAIKAL